MEDYPQLIVFDLDFTLWDCGGRWIDCTEWPFEERDGRIFDRVGSEFRLYPEVREILDELEEADCQLALASRTTQPNWANWVLETWRLRERFHYHEIYPSSKVQHFEQLRCASSCLYEEMLFFDDEERNIIEVAALGVTAIHVRNGLDRETFRQALTQYQG